jgi:transcriptional regulator with XRE-family HTH domain
MRNLIRKSRQFKGISQEEIADRLNLSQSQYSRMESAGTGLDMDRLKQIADILQIDVAGLLPVLEQNIEGFESLYDKLKTLEEERHLLNFQVGAALGQAAALNNILNKIFEAATRTDNFKDFRECMANLQIEVARS